MKQNQSEYAYLDLLNDVLSLGEDCEDRTGVGTKCLTGEMMKFDLRRGFPALTTKKLLFKSVVGELLWMLDGSTYDADLAGITFGDSSKKTIWTANAQDENWIERSNTGWLGKIYGYQWRRWEVDSFRSDMPHLDQIRTLVDEIKNNPSSRRHIVTAWRPDQLEEMALPPCHILFQVHIKNGFLDLTLYQRSGDVFLGIPFNIAFYSLLMHILGNETGYEPRTFTHFIGDCHLYNNHIPQANLQLSRKPFGEPTLGFNRKPLFNDRGGINYTVGDFWLENYEHHPAIKAEMAV